MKPHSSDGELPHSTCELFLECIWDKSASTMCAHFWGFFFLTLFCDVFGPGSVSTDVGGQRRRRRRRGGVTSSGSWRYYTFCYTKSFSLRSARPREHFHTRQMRAAPNKWINKGYGEKKEEDHKVYVVQVCLVAFVQNRPLNRALKINNNWVDLWLISFLMSHFLRRRKHFTQHMILQLVSPWGKKTRRSIQSDEWQHCSGY